MLDGPGATLCTVTGQDYWTDGTFPEIVLILVDKNELQYLYT